MEDFKWTNANDVQVILRAPPKLMASILIEGALLGVLKTKDIPSSKYKIVDLITTIIPESISSDQVLDVLKGFVVDRWGCTKDCVGILAQWERERHSASFFIRHLAGCFIINTGTPPVIDCSRVDEANFDPASIRLTVDPQETTAVLAFGLDCDVFKYTKKLIQYLSGVKTVVAIDPDRSKRMSCMWFIASHLKMSGVFTEEDNRFLGLEEDVFKYIADKQVSIYVRPADDIAKYTTRTHSVALMILQHCNDPKCEANKKCPFPEPLKCNGCGPDQDFRTKMYTDFTTAIQFPKCIIVHNSPDTSLVGYQPKDLFVEKPDIPHTLFEVITRPMVDVYDYQTVILKQSLEQLNRSIFKKQVNPPRVVAPPIERGQYIKRHAVRTPVPRMLQADARQASYLELPGPLYVNKKELRRFLELMTKKAGGGPRSPAWRARGTRIASGWRGRIE